MRKFYSLLALLLFTGVIFVSCDKDDDTEPQEKKFVPVKISEYEEGVFDGEIMYEYDANNRLIKNEYEDGYFTTYEYDNDNRLSKSNIFEEDSLYMYEVYEYNSSNQLIKIQTYNYKNEAGSYYTNEYDANGNVIKKTEYDSTGSLVLYFTFSYDENSNVINKKYFWADYQTGEVSTDEYEEWIFTYDDMNNIHKSLGFPFLWYTFVNNTLTTTYTEHYGDNFTETYTNTYVYNEDDYPTEYTEETEKYIIEYKEI